MKASRKTKSCLTSVITQNIQNITIMKTTGKMKDETYGVLLKHFVGLKSKMYIFITEYNKQSKKAKSINKNDVNEKLKYENYKTVLFNRWYTRNKINRIQSKDHTIGSCKINDFFSSYDDKKCILKGGYSRLLHFHKSTC